MLVVAPGWYEAATAGTAPRAYTSMPHSPVGKAAELSVTRLFELVSLGTCTGTAVLAFIVCGDSSARAERGGRGSSSV